MHPTTWKASGHVDAFNDPLIDNKDSKKRYRADVLIEDYAEKLNQKAQKEIDKARQRFGEAFDEEQYRNTNPRVMEYLSKQKEILERMGRSLSTGDLDDVKALIEELEIADPESGSRNWTDVKQFNLMFGTKLGASADAAMDLYLRPETAQGIFVNFVNVQKSGRMKVPFGIAQTGKAFRNEIVVRTVLRLPSVLAPTKAAVLPLVKKDGLPEVAQKIIDDLKWDFNVAYDEKDAVGRRYRRQDALGTPFCITVDHQTLEDETVTIRHRDSMQQDRVKISEVRRIINDEVDMRNWLMKM
jgi:glycyl-tRNA synthetase (class II)